MATAPALWIVGCAMFLVACETSLLVGDTPVLSQGGGADAGPTAPDAGDAGDGGLTSPVPWSAGFEDGTLSEWLRDPFGWQNVEAGSSLAVSTDHAHAGSHALKLTMSATGTLTQAMIGRDVVLTEGHYSANYFFPEKVNAQYWVVMKLSNWDGARTDLFDVDIESDASGGMHLFLFNHGSAPMPAPATATLPVGVWVKIEAYFRSTSDTDGRIVVLQDGTQVVDTGNMVTAPGNHVTWSVGTAASYASPSPLTFYVDDAAITAGAL